MRSKSTRLLPSDAELYLLLGIASLQPVANFVRANITDQAFVLNRSVGYFAVIFTTASLAFLLTNLICRVKDKFIVAFAIALAVLFFFNHHIIAALFLDIGENLFGVFVRFRYVLLGQGVLYLLILFGVRKIQPSRQFANIALCSLAVVPAIDLAVVVPDLGAQSTPKKLVEFEIPPPVDSGKQPPSQDVKPNVYLIIPDGLPAPENISSILDGYEYELPNQLKRLGFRMVEESNANGLTTYSSIVTLYSMQYIFEDGEEVNADKHAAIVETFKGNNPVVDGFRSRGYRYFQADGGFHITGCSGYEDVCLAIPGMLTSLDLVFLERTPIGRISDMINDGFEIPDIIERLPAKEEGPFYLQAHISMPHIPFRYDSDCSKYDVHVYPYIDDLKRWRDVFGKQVRCAERQVNQLADAIIKKDPEAIIVIQADHGMAHVSHRPVAENDESALSQFEYTNEDIRLMRGIFTSFYLPDFCASDLRAGLSPVNTFRIVFACLDGRSPDLLTDDRAFMVEERRYVKEIYPDATGVPVRSERYR